MKNRDIELSSFLKEMDRIYFNCEEEKELKNIIAKVKGIKMLLRETKQRDDNYNYFKNPMLPSDYRKINSDYKKQLLYKVERETYRYLVNLRNHNLTEKEIIERTEEYKQDLYKQYGLKRKNKIKVKTTQDEELKLDDLENMNFEEE